MGLALPTGQQREGDFWDDLQQIAPFNQTSLDAQGMTQCWGTFGQVFLLSVPGLVHFVGIFPVIQTAKMM